MCQLVESLKLKDGIVQNLIYHQNRMNSAMDELFPDAPKIKLATAILIPENCKSGVYKVRIIYSNLIKKIEIEPYLFRSIQSLKVIHHESVDYHLKYIDRQILQELFAKRDDCDDIIIVQNGFVGDSFTANILFFDGEKWFTSATPLLRGTKRQFLIDQGKVSEREIRKEDIQKYQKVGLVNALIDFEEMPVIPIDRVVY